MVFVQNVELSPVKLKHLHSKLKAKSTQRQQAQVKY